MSDFLLVDGNAIAWAAQHSYRHLSHRGMPTGLVYGFTSMLRHATHKAKAKQVVVAWDSPPYFRKDIYPGYKAGRHKKDDPAQQQVFADFSTQLPTLRDLLSTLGVHTVAAPRYEADDLISTMCRQASLMPYCSDEGTSSNVKGVVILSRDRDLFINFTIEEPLSLAFFYKDKWITKRNFVREYGCTPEVFINRRFLEGDSSDAIPGIRGVGPKKASKMVGDRDEVLWFINKGECKIEEWEFDFPDAREQLELAIKLILPYDVPTSKVDLVKGVYAQGKSKRMMVELGFESFMKSSWDQPFRDLVEPKNEGVEQLFFDEEEK